MAKIKHGACGVAPYWTRAGEGLHQKRKRDTLQPLQCLALPSGRVLCARCSNCFENEELLPFVSDLQGYTSLMLGAGPMRN